MECVSPLHLSLLSSTLQPRPTLALPESYLQPPPREISTWPSVEPVLLHVADLRVQPDPI